MKFDGEAGQGNEKNHFQIKEFIEMSFITF